MKDFWSEFLLQSVPEGSILIGWLGQSGFAFKNAAGATVAMDVYLTNSVEKKWGLKRLMAAVTEPETFSPDILIATHFHEDHLDLDAVPVILRNSKTKLLAPQTSIDAVKEMDIPESSLETFKEGDKVNKLGVYLEAVYADHGEFVSDPIGVLMEMDGVKVYFCGDTAYRPEHMSRAMEWKPDIIIPPINGANGNMNGEEAALLARDCKARAAIPCHFWTFAEHLGDPQSFKESAAGIVPGCSVIMMCQGETVLFEREAK